MRDCIRAIVPPAIAALLALAAAPGARADTTVPISGIAARREVSLRTCSRERGAKGSATSTDTRT